MRGKYMLNTDTNKLHIFGYCKESKVKPYHYVLFDTEDEALAYGGRAVGFCKECLKEREIILKGREENEV